MIFRSLSLTDFGTYAGTNRIDLSPAPDQPIVLIGGSNGAGKTTILEALLLCLHGRRALGVAVRERDYEAHVASRIHTPAKGGGGDRAALSLVFEHSEGGHSSEYVVERSWTRAAKGKVKERLELSRDGQIVDELPESAWQDFLDGLVPPGIADLFLFDGERIQELADDANGQQLKDAVRRLMGLDVVDQLRADLRRYVASQGKAGEAHELVTSHERASEALTAAKDEVARLRDARTEIKREIDQLNADNERVRVELAQLGGALVDKREDLRRRKTKAAERSAGLEAEVQELVSGLLPFAICPDMARGVRKRLVAEQAADEVEILMARISDQSDKLDRALKSRRGEQPASEAIATLLAGDVEPSESRIHDLTPSERVLLDDQLRRTLDDVPGRAAKLARQLDRSEEEHRIAEEQLEAVPPEDDVRPLILQSQDLERALGGLEERIERVDDEIAQARHLEKVAEREERKAREQVESSGKAAERVQRALETIGVLERFEEATQTAKLRDVERETALFFNRLSRKKLLSEVSIDPEEFRVTITRWDKTELPKERLSAGEKQLFAISVLWAFAKVSERALPIVIDTPLARLDRQHRDQLLREYLPHVSHQVVVLSTDTEVDAAAAGAIGPHVARTYHLEHDAKLCRTSVEDGYFHQLDRTADAR